MPTGSGSLARDRLTTGPGRDSHVTAVGTALTASGHRVAGIALMAASTAVGYALRAAGSSP